MKTFSRFLLLLAFESPIRQTSSFSSCFSVCSFLSPHAHYTRIHTHAHTRFTSAVSWITVVGCCCLLLHNSSTQSGVTLHGGGNTNTRLRDEAISILRSTILPGTAEFTGNVAENGEFCFWCSYCFISSFLSWSDLLLFWRPVTTSGKTRKVHLSADCSWLSSCHPPWKHQQLEFHGKCSLYPVWHSWTEAVHALFFWCYIQLSHIDLQGNIKWFLFSCIFDFFFQRRFLVWR